MELPPKRIPNNIIYRMVNNKTHHDCVSLDLPYRLTRYGNAAYAPRKDWPLWPFDFADFP